MTDESGSLSALEREPSEFREVIVRGIRAHFSFAALLAILFLTFLDNTVVSAVLTSVQAKLHANVSQLQWVVGGYALTFASLMLMFGALGDNFGRKRMMLIGVAIFCGGSIVCAISVNPSELVIGRIVMGIGAAASEPATLSMIRHIYPDHKSRARALGAWAAVSGLALAMGPVVGGILVGIWSWRAVFWFNLLFGGLAFIVARIALPESVNALRKRVDYAGFFFAAVILGTATFACIQGELTGYESGWVITLFIVSFLTVPAFYLCEKSAKSPMLELGFFRRKSFTGSAFIAFASYFSIFSIFFFVALYLEVVVSVSAYGLALDFLPLLGGIVVASLFTGRWIGRIGSRIPMTVGCLMAGLGVILTFAVIGPHVDLTTLGWTMGLAGIGFGIVIVPVNATALSSLPASNSGMASSAVNTSRELGAVAGVAILGSIVNGQLTVNLTARLIQLGIPAAYRQLVITAVTTGQTASAEAGLNPATRKAFQGTINKVIKAAYGALTHGLDIALIASALLLMVSAAVAYLTGTSEKLELVNYVEAVPATAIN
ncbi:MAG TPA: MFS transporter [Acidimicrobiales bacterium]|nr:MFS transporter [Acidimicrobiales bacterium]